MKRNKLILLLLLLLQVAFAPLAYSDHVTINGIKYSLASDLSSARVVNDQNYASLTEVEIPDSIYYNLTHIPVTELWKEAFANCTRLESIKIGSCVKTINSCCFKNCRNLRSIFLPASLSEIVIEVSIYDNVCSGGSIFNGCTSLESIVVDEANPTLDSRGGCNAIIETATNRLIVGCKSTIIPESVEMISDCAFQNVALDQENVVLSNLSLGRCSFYGATLHSVTIGDNITTIPNSCFRSSVIDNIEFGNSLLTIENYAFNESVIKNDLVLPESLITIRASSFRFATFPAITFGGSLKTIGSVAFRDSKGYQSLTIPKSVEQIDGYAFFGAPFEHITFNNSMKNFGYSLVRECKKLKSLVIPRSVNVIEDYSVAVCYSLDSLTIMGDAEIGKGVLDATPVKYIRLGGNITPYITFDGLAFQFPEAKIVLGPGVTSVEGVKFYSNQATSFYCEGLTPPTAGEFTFSDGLYQSEVHVHKTAVNNYRNSLYWCNFSNIIGDLTFYGDVDDNGIVDISDVNAAIDVMLGRMDNELADVNGDGAVDITDVNAIINKMLGK